MESCCSHEVYFYLRISAPYHIDKVFLIVCLFRRTKGYICGVYEYVCDVNMVQAMININENANSVLNIVKAKYGLKDKSEAINLVVEEYKVTCLEPELRPEYKKKLQNIVKGKHLSREKFEKMVR